MGPSATTNTVSRIQARLLRARPLARAASVGLVATALLLPLAVGLLTWLGAPHDAAEAAGVASEAALEEVVLTQWRMDALFEANGGLDPDAYAALEELEEEALESITRRWGESPWPGSVQYMAEWCLSGDPEPLQVSCEADGVWMSGVEAAVLLHHSLGDPAALEQLLDERQQVVDAAAQRAERAARHHEELLGQVAGWQRHLVQRLLGAVGGAVVLLLLAVAVGRRRWLTVVVTQHRVELGGEVVPAAEIVGCQVEGGRLVVRLRGGRQLVAPAVADPAELRSLEQAIGRITPSLERRKEEARARVAVEAQRARMKKQLRDR